MRGWGAPPPLCLSRIPPVYAIRTLYGFRAPTILEAQGSLSEAPGCRLRSAVGLVAPTGGPDQTRPSVSLLWPLLPVDPVYMRGYDSGPRRPGDEPLDQVVREHER